MDAVAETLSGAAVGLSERPSEIFRRQCFVSGDPDETAAPHTIEHVGRRLFPVGDRLPAIPTTPAPGPRALERFVEPLGEKTRAKVLGENVRRIYRLD